MVKLSEEGLRKVKQKLSYIQETSTLLTKEVAETSKKLREDRSKAKSADPSTRFATAKQFSIARARSREPNNQ